MSKWLREYEISNERLFDKANLIRKDNDYEQNYKRRLFNIKWCCWYCRNDNGGNAKSVNRMGNTAGKNDNKYFREWSIDSIGYIPCYFRLWIVYSSDK